MHFRGYDNPDANLRISDLELKMMHLCAAIRNKKGWAQKVSDTTIVSKWAEEAAVQMGLKGGRAKRAVRLAMEELRWQAGEEVLPAAVDGTFAADDALPAELHEALEAGFAALSDVPDASKDWHPGSHGQVLDLVHPSLFAFEHGVTPVLGGHRRSSPLPHTDSAGWAAFIHTPSARPLPPRTDAAYRGWSSQAGLAWLPAEFALSADGKSCEIKSYINNLEPSAHKRLYDVIAKCFVRVVPLLEATLSAIAEPEEYPQELSYERPKSHRRPHLPVATVRDGGSDCGGSDGGSDYGGYGGYGGSSSPYGQPIPPSLPAKFTPPPRPPLSLSLKGRELQVIVKLASIRLTPQAPKYDGGSWHVEGMADDAIVATAIYYAACENVTPSSLAFRQAHSNYVPSAQNYADADDGVADTYSLYSTESKLVQPLGACDTIARRALAFPNTLQHRVQPFQLLDSTKPGRRDILVFFLVDPTRPIPSSAIVPPQQASWRTASKGGKSRAATSGMSFGEACERRERLMAERGQDSQRITMQVFEQTFSLCEH